MNQNQMTPHDPMTPQPQMTPEQMQVLQQQQQMMMQQQMLQQQMLQQQSNPMMNGGKIHNRERTVAILLCFFLGGLGAHKFYTGRVAMGVLYALFFWTFLPAIAAFVELIMFAVQSDEQFDRQYNYA